MARITDTTTTLTGGAWAGDYLNREHLVPGGSKVVAAAFTVNGEGRAFIPSGTLIGRTFAERLAGTAFGPAGDLDDEVFITAFDVFDALVNSDVDLYRPGSIVKENFLPQFGSISAALTTKYRDLYVTTRGVN